MRDEPPMRCVGTGGRQVRSGPEYGHIYDHFSNVFDYAGGPQAFATTRLQPGCSNETSVLISGTKGKATIGQRQFGIVGEKPWQLGPSTEKPSHQLEQDA